MTNPLMSNTQDLKSISPCEPGYTTICGVQKSRTIPVGKYSEKKKDNNSNKDEDHAHQNDSISMS